KQGQSGKKRQKHGDKPSARSHLSGSFGHSPDSGERHIMVQSQHLAPNGRNDRRKIKIRAQYEGLGLVGRLQRAQVNIRTGRLFRAGVLHVVDNTDDLDELFGRVILRVYEWLDSLADRTFAGKILVCRCLIDYGHTLGARLVPFGEDSTDSQADTERFEVVWGDTVDADCGKPDIGATFDIHSGNAGVAEQRGRASNGSRL